jgi:hypothetical protein
MAGTLLVATSAKVSAPVVGETPPMPTLMAPPATNRVADCTVVRPVTTIVPAPVRATRPPRSTMLGNWKAPEPEIVVEGSK